MTVLYVNSTDLGSANALAAASGDGKVAELDGFVPADMAIDGDITLAAHTDPDATTLGGRTPEELANEFNTKFRGKKDNLNHVYLISCEAGKSINGKPSLAERFATAMDNRGFHNLSVHAVTSPADRPIYGMRVQVVTKKGAVSDHGVGHMSAYTYKDKYSSDLDETISQLEERVDFLVAKNLALTRGRPAKTLPDDELKELRAKQTEWRHQLDLRQNDNYQINNIISTENYKEVMQQDHNTFTHVKPRQAISDDVAYALNHLQGERDRMQKELRDLEPDDDKAKEILERHLGYNTQDRDRVLAQPMQNAQAIIVALEGTRTRLEKWRSNYYKDQLKPLIVNLDERVKNAPKQATAAPSRQSTNQSIQQSSSIEHSTNQIVQQLPPIARPPATSKRKQGKTDAGARNVVQGIATSVMGSTGGEPVPLVNNPPKPAPNPQVPIEELGLSLRRRPVPAPDVRVANDLISASQPRTALGSELKAYREERKSGNELFSFLSFIAFLNKGLNWSWLTKYIDCFKRDVKVSAADKLFNRVEHKIDPTKQEDDQNKLTDQEIKALNDGKLGKIVSNHGGLEKILADTATPEDKHGSSAVMR